MTLKGAIPGGIELSGLVSLDRELPIHESEESLLSWLCSRPVAVPERCLLNVAPFAAAMGLIATPFPIPIPANSGSGGGRGSTPFS